MKPCVVVPILMSVCVAGCVRTPPPAPIPARSIAVFPANNRTGAPLLIAGASFAEQYVFQTAPYTVGDALAAEARAQLSRRGFDVVSSQVIEAAIGAQAPSSADAAAALAARNHIEGAVLYVEIRRWESSGGSEPMSVIAAVCATLIDPASRRVLWRGQQPSQPVPTPGIISLGDAYAVAAHTLMTKLLAPLAPVPREQAAHD